MGSLPNQSSWSCNDAIHAAISRCTFSDSPGIITEVTRDCDVSGKTFLFVV